MADYTLSAKITGDSKSFSDAFEKAQNKMKTFNERAENFGNKLTSGGKNVTKFGAKVSLATAPLLLLGKSVFNTGMEFESSMSKVKAISGATGKDLEDLTAKAREMGKETRYSASEAADAMGFMALAGWDTQQMIAGLPPVLNLATAGELELARAAEVVTGNINAFGLEAKDATRVTDVMAKAQANSGTSAEELARALEVVAPAAAAAGHEIEGTSALIGILADQNIKGSKAGTYLNSMYNDITKSAKNGKIAIGETAVAVYDSTGKMRDMTDIMVDVDKATQEMTQEQKDSALAGVFQQQSLKGVNSLLNAGTEKLKGLEEGLYDSKGAAEEMAATMDDNLKGKVFGLGSSFDEFKLRLYDVSEGPMNTIIEKVTSLVDWFSSLDDTTLSTIVAIAGLAIVAGPLIIAIGTLITSTGTIIGLVSKFTGVLNLLSIAKMKDKTDTLVLIGLYAKDAAAKVLSTGKTVLMTGATTAWSVAAKAGAIATKLLGGAIAFLTSTIGIAIAAITAIIAIGVLLWKNWDTVKEKASQLGGWISNKWDGIKESTSRTWNNVKSTMSNTMSAAGETIQEKLNNMKNAYDRHGGGIKGVVAATMEGIKGYYSSGFTFMDTLTGGKLSAVSSKFTTQFNGIKDTVRGALDSIVGFFRNLRLPEIKIPKPKLPRFSLQGKFSLAPPSVPKLSVSWNAAGAIFTKPYIFGNQGVGEAGPEAILPISKLGGMMADTLNKMGYNNDRSFNRNEQGYGSNQYSINVNLNDANIYDTRDIGEIAKELAEEIGREVSFG